jgi:hypothetical protein
MKGKNIAAACYLFILLQLTLSCTNADKNAADDTAIKPGTSLLQLSNIINLPALPPDSVLFSYKKMGDASDNIPGPTDYMLEAVLFYNDTTINMVKELSNITHTDELNTEDILIYQFDWLNDDIKSSFKGLNKQAVYPADKFYKGPLLHGSYIIIGNKLFIYLHTM